MSLASPLSSVRRARRPGPEADGDGAPASIRSCVRGVGAALPARAVSNAELATRVDTSDEWIVQRTGIRQRYVAGPDETTSSLALKAARAALRSGGLEAADIDLVIVATSTPDYTFPAVATQVQADLGIVEGAAFDLQAVCTGFVYAVVTAEKFLRSGSHKRALVIGAETFSRILDWNDRTTCVLFGDGAGAIVLEARKRGLAGATVIKGFMGFGAHSRIHTAKLLELSQDLPIIVEIVDAVEKIEAFMPDLERMVGDGLITIERAEVRLYRSRPPE